MECLTENLQDESLKVTTTKRRQIEREQIIKREARQRDLENN